MFVCCCCCGGGGGGGSGGDGGGGGGGGVCVCVGGGSFCVWVHTFLEHIELLSGSFLFVSPFAFPRFQINITI